MFAKHLCPQNASHVVIWANREKCMLQRAITLKLRKLELWLLCISLLIEIYLHMKFHVDISYTFWTIAKVKVSGHTNTHAHRQTDRQTHPGQNYMPPRSSIYWGPKNLRSGQFKTVGWATQKEDVFLCLKETLRSKYIRTVLCI